MASEQQSSKKAGVVMIFIAWLLIMAMLGLFFDDVLEQQLNPNSDPVTKQGLNYTEVVLQPNRQHHYVSDGEINDQGVTFLVDTGATDVVVPAKLASRLGLRKGAQGYAYTANGTVAIYRTTLDKLVIGDIELYGLRASINPAMNDELILLGMSALSRLEFSQVGENLVLRQAR